MLGKKVGAVAVLWLGVEDFKICHFCGSLFSTSRLKALQDAGIRKKTRIGYVVDSIESDSEGPLLSLGPEQTLVRYTVPKVKNKKRKKPPLMTAKTKARLKKGALIAAGTLGAAALASRYEGELLNAVRRAHDLAVKLFTNP